MKGVCFLVFLFCTVVIEPISAQCVVEDFILPSEVCVNQNIVAQPAAVVNEDVEWDFCSGEFNASPTAEPDFQIAEATGRPSIELVKENDTWFGFITGTWTNSLHVLEFSDGIDQPPSSVTNFGNLDNRLNNPGSIKMIKKDDRWYGIIHNTGSSEILKVMFGDSFNEVSEVSVLTSGVGYLNSGLAISKDSREGWIGVISNSDNTFTIIRFGQDLHSSAPEDLLETAPVPNPNNLGDIDLISFCGEWFGAAVNLGGGNTYLLSFGENLFSIPKIEQIASLSVDNAARLRFALDGNEYFLFITSLDGLWHLLKFGDSLHPNPTVENQNNLNGSLGRETYALGLAKEASVWTIFSVTQNNGQVYRVTHQQPCSAIPETSTEIAPLVKYTSPGFYPVSMKLISKDVGKSKFITVAPEVAPDIDFSVENICAGHDVFFHALNSSGDIQEIEWSFGDGTTETVNDPVHQFVSEGSYNTTLKVVASNGCSNNVSKRLSIFSKPSSSFTGEERLLCTNNVSTFPNTTADTYLGNLSYQWLLDDNAVSTNRDLQYTFTTTGVKKITLITSIPGCASEIVKTTSQVEAGPVVDFSFNGTCEEETYSFQNQISESVETYLWDFGNGNTSSEPNPAQVFAAFGDYTVSLTATNSTGCENVKTKNVAVHSNPVIDFSAEGPPNACSGSLTKLYNQTTNPDAREIASWLWHLNDSTTQTEKDGHHIFPVAGVYTVSLSATTADGCQAKGEKEVTIHPSPSTDFTHTPACDNAPAYFTGPSGNDIASWYWEIGSSYYTTSSPTHTFKMAGDYPLYLQVTGANGCIATSRQTVHVPVPLSPDFSLIKNCPDHEAVFTDVTTGIDPVISQEWYFDSGETFTGSPFTYAFQKTGTETVMFKVTAQSGCVYQVSKAIEVLPAPVAGFTADPAVGAYPHEVTFTNTSLNATTYLWSFSDGAVSDEVSPVHTFEQVGSYSVKLTASNEQQCQDTFEAAISTVAPLPDVDIEMISLATNPDGTSKLIITVHNKGNTILKNIFLDIDFSGGLTLRQQVPNGIAPGSKFNMVLNTGIVDVETLRYLCAFIDLPNDIAPSGNRACKQFEHVLVVFPAYPNPAMAVLNLEWISETDKPVRASLVDPLGRKILVADFSAAEGLNRQMLDVGELEGGVYTLLLEDGAVRRIQRILITR